MKSFFQLSHNCNFTEKEPHRSYFLMIFERLFIILFDVKRLVNLSKAWKKQKHSPDDAQQKNWSGKFHKIQPKETVMKSSF